MPDGLSENERRINHQGYDGDEHELTGRVVRARRRDRVVGKYQGKNDDGSQCNQCRADAVETEGLFAMLKTADQ